MHIVALSTCHNRHELTLLSLEDLHSQNLPNNVSLSITIVDDGSTDGTEKAVRTAYPEVEIIKGDGNLYWAGGMRYGWEKSIKQKKFDALLVFNDDVRLKKNALRELIETSHYARKYYGPLFAVTGAFTDSKNEVITYGGYRRSSRWHPLRFEIVSPIGVPCQVDTLHMNCALIPSESLCKVGFLAWYFKHDGADTEFGLKLRKAGGTVWLTPRAIGKCDRNVTKIIKDNRHMSLREHYISIIGEKGASPLVRARFFHDYAGLFWPILWSGPYIRVLFNTVFDFLRYKFH